MRWGHIWRVVRMTIELVSATYRCTTCNLIFRDLASANAHADTGHPAPGYYTTPETSKPSGIIDPSKAEKDGLQKD